MLFSLRACTWQNIIATTSEKWHFITNIMGGNMAVLGTSIKVSKLTAGMMEVLAEASETDAAREDVIVIICNAFVN